MIKVLIIEDDPSLRLLWRVGLEGHGMQVFEACDGVKVSSWRAGSNPT